MTRYTKIHLNEIIKDIQLNFSQIINYIIYYDSTDEDLKAWDLIYTIEALEHEKLIELILLDFKNRDLNHSSTLLYNALLYGIVNNEDSKSILIDFMKKEQNIKFKSYLWSLNEQKGRDGDLNIEDVFNKI